MPPPGQGDRLDGRRRESSVAVDEDRQGRIDQPEACEQEVGLGRVGLEPLVRLRSAREEIAKTVVLGVHPPTHDLHLWANRAHAVDSSAALPAYASRRRRRSGSPRSTVQRDTRPRNVTQGRAGRDRRGLQGDGSTCGGLVRARICDARRHDTLGRAPTLVVALLRFAPARRDVRFAPRRAARLKSGSAPPCPSRKVSSANGTIAAMSLSGIAASSDLSRTASRTLGFLLAAMRSREFPATLVG
jgi:hypothetical protein